MTLFVVHPRGHRCTYVHVKRIERHDAYSTGERSVVTLHFLDADREPVNVNLHECQVTLLP